MPDPGTKRDSIANTFVVAVGVSLVCSVLVSTAAVVLKPRQERNQTLYRQQVVLEVAGLYRPGDDVAELFDAIDVRLVDLASGDYTNAFTAGDFDPVEAAKDSELGVAIPAALDVAGIGRRAIYAPVYIVDGGASGRQIILPVYGRGLWSTLYGYVAVAPDGNTVRALQFYEHAETPGLGDQIDRPAWLAEWEDKRLRDADGEVRIEVVRGQVPDDASPHQVDGLSGATLTGRGVTNTLRYWAGPHGFGPYLDKLAKEAATDG